MILNFILLLLQFCGTYPSVSKPQSVLAPEYGEELMVILPQQAISSDPENTVKDFFCIYEAPKPYKNLIPLRAEPYDKEDFLQSDRSLPYYSIIGNLDIHLVALLPIAAGVSIIFPSITHYAFLGPLKSLILKVGYRIYKRKEIKEREDFLKSSLIQTLDPLEYKTLKDNLKKGPYTPHNLWGARRRVELGVQKQFGKKELKCELIELKNK